MNNLAEEVYHKLIDKDYCSQWMGVEPLLLAEGHCRIKMTVHQQMLNGFGILHGGIAYAFADSAFAFASNSYGRLSVSMNGVMNFAKSAREGDVLVAEAKAISVTNKTATFDVSIIEQDSSELYYTFRGIVYRTSQEVLDQ
ncbi:MAG: hotdog fold thioesterase [Bacteroidota bacterium]